MAFKQHWEKTDKHHQLPDGVIEQMTQLAYPSRNLDSHEMISGGCANLNYKIKFKNDEEPHILRIYIRDKDSAYKEQKIGKLLKGKIPVPQISFIGDYQEYRFAITEFMKGITLRDLLLSNLPHNVDYIMHEVGATLATIGTNKFPKAGFFDKDLNIGQEFDGEELKRFSLNCLKHPHVQKYLSQKTIASLEHLLNTLPKDNDDSISLVHGDFDPANILVDKINDSWEVTAILDWEFAYAGCWLNDVANMLRYAHQMPLIYTKAFLEGLTSKGLVFPNNWQIIVRKYNLAALLDSMTRHPLDSCPNIREDICALIENIISQLHKEKF